MVDDEDAVIEWLRAATGARAVTRTQHIQTLWGGYGSLVRVHLDGAAVPSVILKDVRPPRGEVDSISDARKRRSYDVETAFYRERAPWCGPSSRVANLLASEIGDDGWRLLLEDLEPGDTARKRAFRGSEIGPCLGWLASFHATFLGVEPSGLWEEGTYWHLATRPDELAAIDEPELRAAAPAIDARLRAARFRTLVHGDAKEANFCFGATPLAAVDFQYVGGGTGMKDVAYLLSGNFTTERAEADALDTYFLALREALGAHPDASSVESEWRTLYPFAAADFHRFLAGWAKSHWKRDAWGQRVVRDAIRAL